jgi:hypothetical protein
VRAYDDASLEAQQEVLPDCVHGLEAPPIDAFGDLGRACARMERLDLEPLADERLETPRCTVERIAFGHIGQRSAMHPAKAGAVAALVWATAEPFDRRLFRHDYSDVALLGKLVTRSRAWPVAGLAMHAANGAAFGLVYKRVRVPALTMALAEHTLLFPLGAVADRFHPARGTPGLAPLFTKPGFAQATFRHALFGWTLGRLADQRV